MSKIRTFETKTLEQLEDEINRFGSLNEIIATQTHDAKWSGDTWKAIVYYKTKELDIEPIKENKSNEVMATERQIYALKKLGFKGDINSVTKSEAMKIIKESKEKK